MRLAHLDTLAKEGTDMATGNYRLTAKTSADMLKRRGWNEPKESSGHAEAEGLEKARVYDGLQELSNEIEQQERYASRLEKRIMESEEKKKEHPDAALDAVINEAKEELVNLKSAIQARKTELEQKRHDAGQRSAEIGSRWKGYAEEQEKAGNDPDAFAAGQVLIAQELAGTPSEIKPEELKSAIKGEAQKRHTDRIEKHESEIEAQERKLIKEITDELTAIESELMSELTAQEAFLKGETAEGKAFLASFEKKKRAITSFGKKTYWFNKAQREQKQNEELKKLKGELEGEVAEIRSKSDPGKHKLRELLEKGWHGLTLEIAESPAAQRGVYDEIPSKKKEVIMAAHTHSELAGPHNPHYARDWKSKGARDRGNRTEREIGIMQARETLRNLAHQVQNKVHAKINEIDKIVKEKLELPYYW
ncbi:MAG TPA: hypothetical protein DEF00_03765 [Candidatus Taylorbacteria bacterium]|nr:MAG: hypothetical protein UY03_C0013G0016 [Parcubacteria group bacterium GW2011_GWA2_47_64]KKU96011.1 MAG: hypothetical protein UY29_C0017G0015 [Parcubacteria group bacterium GW2011_GWC2_48_17]HBV01476.1 hypothetical protein [Candidatus Taylorbacteria bacterium]